jgi:hypothetical protein
MLSLSCLCYSRRCRCRCHALRTEVWSMQLESAGRALEREQPQMSRPSQAGRTSTKGTALLLSFSQQNMERGQEETELGFLGSMKIERWQWGEAWQRGRENKSSRQD